MFRSLTAVAIASLAATAVALPAGASAAPAPPQQPTIVKCETPQRPVCPQLPPSAGVVVCTPKVCYFADGHTQTPPAGMFPKPDNKPGNGNGKDDGRDDRGEDRGGNDRGGDNGGGDNGGDGGGDFGGGQDF